MSPSKNRHSPLYLAIRGSYFLLLCLALPGAVFHLRLSSAEPLAGWVVALGMYGVLLWCVVYFLVQTVCFPRRSLGASGTLAGLLLNIGIVLGVGGSLGFAAWQLVYAPLVALTVTIFLAIPIVYIACGGREDMGLGVAIAFAIGASVLGVVVWELRHPLLNQLASLAPPQRLVLVATMIGHMGSEWIVGYRVLTQADGGGSKAVLYAGEGEGAKATVAPKREIMDDFGLFYLFCVIASVLAFFVAVAWPVG